MEYIQGTALRRRYLNKRCFLLGDSQSSCSTLPLQTVAIASPPLLLSGHSDHLNLELPPLQAEISPNAHPEGPLNKDLLPCYHPKFTFQCLGTPLFFPFHCPLLRLKFYLYLLDLHG